MLGVVLPDGGLLANGVSVILGGEGVVMLFGRSEEVGVVEVPLLQCLPELDLALALGCLLGVSEHSSILRQ